MKIFLAFLSLVALLLGGQYLMKERDENKQHRAEQRSKEELCMQALRAAVLPTAQKVPRFLQLDVWPQGMSRDSDSGAVVHATARVVTLDNSRGLSAAPDYSMTCLIKDGAVVNSAITPSL